MKKTIFLIAFTLLISTQQTIAQCKSANLTYSCVLNQENYAIYLRDFNTKLYNGYSDKNNNTKWATVLNSRVIYRFYVCTEDGLEKNVNMYLHSTSKKKTNIIYATTDASKNSFFDFACKKSGIYYITIEISGKPKKIKTCAIGIQAFVSKTKTKNNKQNPVYYSLDDTFDNTKKVKSLVLFPSDIDTLSVNIASKFTELENLDIAQLQLCEIPNSINYFSNLKILNCSFNNISAYNIELFLKANTNIEEINISENNISEEEKKIEKDIS